MDKLKRSVQTLAGLRVSLEQALVVDWLRGLAETAAKFLATWHGGIAAPAVQRWKNQ